MRKDFPPGQDTVYDLKLRHVRQVSEAELRAGLATQASPRFLLLWDGVAFDYELFDEAALNKDLERIERFYRARGYYEAKTTVGRVIRVDEHRVRVEIVVDEGQPVLVTEVVPSGLTKVPFAVSLNAIEAISLQPGDRLDEAVLEQSRKGVLEALSAQGYAFAVVETVADVDLPTRSARVDYRIRPGPVASYGDIRIEGLSEISESVVRENLKLYAGDRYSSEDIRDAQAALLNLGVFSSVQIDADRSQPKTGTVPLTVRVSETQLRSVRMGGGARLDPLRLALFGIVGWADRNFLGDLRHFDVSARPGATLFPTNVNNLAQAPTKVLLENSILASLRQPSFLEGRTTGRLAAEYNVFPLLFPLEEGVDPDNEVIIGYNQIRTAAGLERAFFSHHLFASISYNLHANFPFTYQGPKPAGLDTVLVSFPELGTRLDFRDKQINPTNGILISNRLQVAGYIFGGNVSDIRVRPELRAFRALIGDKLVLATRATFGFLFPSNYGQTLNPTSAEGEQVTRDPADPNVIEDQHKLLFRTFYSGGPNSNRGYGFREVGPHGPVGFLIPRGAQCGATTQPDGTVTPLSLDVLEQRGCIRPLGGLTLWEASVELRFRLSGPLRGVFFADASDVTENVLDFRGFRVPHLSVGPGLRYQTPVGPLRLDIGFRWPGLQSEGSQSEEDAFYADRVPKPLIADAPLVGDINATIHLAIGEAF